MQLALKATGALQGLSQANRDICSLRVGLRPSGKLLEVKLTVRPVGSLP